MAEEKKPALLAEDTSFEILLDFTCNRLWDVKVRHSIDRIREMDGRLSALEEELEKLIREKAD
jgi:hypothetical protein